MEETGFIEWIQGGEEHTSSWGKLKIEGLDSFAVKEDYHKYDKHHWYQSYCANVPVDTIFAFYHQDGDKYGTSTHQTYICQVSLGNESEVVSPYSDAYVKGQFVILAHGSGKTKGKRLWEWWENRPKGASLINYALACGQYIDKRGYKGPPTISG